MGAVAGRDLGALVRDLVSYAEARGLVGAADRAWAHNAVLEAVGACGPGPDPDWLLADGPAAGAGDGLDLEAALAALADVAVANGCARDTASGRDRAAMRAMGVLTPRPSQVADAFRRLAAEGGPRAATDWFYRLCCDVGYVRRQAIARNLAWTTPTRWGELEVTVNLSKPEKDPRDIAAAGAAPAGGDVYPACQLCVENEGHPGRPADAPGGEHPARQNLRIVPIRLGGERWGLQYSPYAYFDEHCIAMSARHRPMHVDRQALSCLLDFVDLFPHYFVGSNADLPIVGGSILSHDHFQGGAHEFPMMRAGVDATFRVAGSPRVSGEVLVWPLSVLRLRSNDRGELLEACVRVLDAWRSWSDPVAGVVCRTPDGVPHNTVTPVVRRVGDAYEAYLALRCNVTSEEHPLGVFHPHAERHHIKRENIGLIEVMGLAILPPRLKGELAAVRDVLLEGRAAGSGADGVRAALGADGLAASHADWAADVYARRADELDGGRCEEVLRDEVGRVFAGVLEDAGVFKWDDEGRAAQRRFVEALG